jgi:hypothetical protein
MYFNCHSKYIGVKGVVVTYNPLSEKKINHPFVREISVVSALEAEIIDWIGNIQEEKEVPSLPVVVQNDVCNIEQDETALPSRLYSSSTINAVDDYLQAFGSIVRLYSGIEYLTNKGYISYLYTAMNKSIDVGYNTLKTTLKTMSSSKKEILLDFGKDIDYIGYSAVRDLLVKRGYKVVTISGNSNASEIPRSSSAPVIICRKYSDVEALSIARTKYQLSDYKSSVLVITREDEINLKGILFDKNMDAGDNNNTILKTISVNKIIRRLFS